MRFSGNLMIVIWTEFKLLFFKFGIFANTIYYAVSINKKRNDYVVITCYIEHEHNQFIFWALNDSDTNYSYFVNTGI